MAIAGGATLTFPQNQGYLHTEDSILSPDGICRTFDADAKGTIFGDGVGVVVLKRLSDAIRDQDPIYATIIGWGTNNDGNDKAGYTAPSVSGQREAILRAHQMAGISADSISYIEAHGTGTLVGDPIEIEALTQAFRKSTDRKQFCAIGSLKSNVGHLDVAAGVSATIKTALALNKRRLPASLHFRSPNPRIDFANSPFFVQEKSTDWPSNNRGNEATPRRAGVSSFGVGGTNAHLVLEEYVSVDNQLSQPDPNMHFIGVSAKSESSLHRMRESIARHLENDEALALKDVAYTLNQGRKPMSIRFGAWAATPSEAIAKLRAGGQGTNAIDAPKIAFLFPGQGSQHVGMARDWANSDAKFSEWIDEASAALMPHVGIDLRRLAFESDPEDTKLDQTQYAQPALFMVSYAIGKWLLDRGLFPDFVVGHSVGEFAAATLSGIMSLEVGAELIAARGRLMQSLPPGAMLAINIEAHRLQELQLPGIDIAAFNAPQMCVLSGTHESIRVIADQIEKGRWGEEVVGRMLRTSHAFHSAMMDPAIEAFRSVVQRVPLSESRVPFLSTVTASFLDGSSATDVDYWTMQIRKPVQFSASISQLLQHPRIIFVEVGPGQSLSTLVKQHPLISAKQRIVAMQPHPKQTGVPQYHLDALVRLWEGGAPIENIDPVARSRGRKIHLPTYSFEKTRHWFACTENADVSRQSNFASLEIPQCNDQSARVSECAGNESPMSNRPNLVDWRQDVIQQQTEIMQRQLELLSRSR